MLTRFTDGTFIEEAMRSADKMAERCSIASPAEQDRLIGNLRRALDYAEREEHRPGLTIRDRDNLALAVVSIGDALRLAEAYQAVRFDEDHDHDRNAYYRWEA